MAANSVPNVWAQMNYVPPRGQCNYKVGIVASRCSCLRFMLHPLKSASSFECDGCGHHASFHSMENKAEDEIRKKWALEVQQRQGTQERAAERPKKRLRELGYGSVDDQPKMSNIDRIINATATSAEELERVKSAINEENSAARAKTRARVAALSRGRATPKRKKISEVLDDDADYVELD